jgi:gliding motility-associated-like protein
MRTKRIYFNIAFMFIFSISVFSQTVETPVLQYVTVDRATQRAHIGWIVNDPSILNGYRIKRQIFNFPNVVNGSWNNIDTINDPNQFEYIDNSTNYGVSNPGLGPESYRLIAFRIVGANIELSNVMSNQLSTIYLHPIEFNSCREQNSLIWSSYKGFVGQGTYKIYYSDTPLGTLMLLSEQPMSDTTYVHSQVDANKQYYYYVEAFSSAGFSSLSNIQGVTTTMLPVPTIMNADYGTVAYYNQVELSFTVDATAQVNSYKILKSKSINGPWDTIASFPKGIAQIKTIDNINTNSEIYYYKAVAINNCLLESRISNIASNILLEAWPDANIKYTNQLKWNAYETWLGGVAGYKVFRSNDGASFEEIAQLGPNELTYTDNIEQFVVPETNGQPTKGQFCYYIEATEGVGNPNGIAGTSKSNISCVQQEAVVFVPNAFNPQSTTDENRTFRPVMSFVNDYSLIIYNRWGEIVFKSTDPLNGWDGTYNGKLQPKATYVYYLKYRTKDNKKVEKSGQVNLVY